MTEPSGPADRSSLAGFSHPRSPDGQLSMLTAPPWHFAGEVLLVEFDACDDAVVGFLPPGLAHDTSQSCAAVFASWRWCSGDHGERVSPSTSSFHEFLVMIPAKLGERSVARVPFAWVDDVVSMTRGWVQGMPKQMGRIGLTQPCGVGSAVPRLARGATLHGELEANSAHSARASVTLDDQCGEPPVIHTVPLVHTQWDSPWAGNERPERLMTSEVTNVEFGEVWTGAATFSLESADRDVAALAPRGVGRGYYFEYAETLVRGRPDDVAAGRCTT